MLVAVWEPVEFTVDYAKCQILIGPHAAKALAPVVVDGVMSMSSI